MLRFSKHSERFFSDLLRVCRMLLSGIQKKLQLDRSIKTFGDSQIFFSYPLRLMRLDWLRHGLSKIQRKHDSERRTLTYVALNSDFAAQQVHVHEFLDNGQSETPCLGISECSKNPRGETPRRFGSILPSRSQFRCPTRPASMIRFAATH